MGRSSAPKTFSHLRRLPLILISLQIVHFSFSSCFPRFLGFQKPDWFALDSSGNMKFGETYTEFLHKEKVRFSENCSHVEYKRLKNVLKTCQSCKALQESSAAQGQEGASNQNQQLCQCQSCPCKNLFPNYLIYFNKLVINWCFTENVI